MIGRRCARLYVLSRRSTAPDMGVQFSDNRPWAYCKITIEAICSRVSVVAFR